LIEVADIGGPTTFDPDADETVSVSFDKKSEGRMVYITDHIEPETTDDSADSDDQSTDYCPACGEDVFEEISPNTGDINFCPHCGEDVSDVNFEKETSSEFTPYTRNTVMGYFEDDKLEAVCIFHEFQHAPLYGRGIKYGPLQRTETNTGDVRAEMVWMS
jgi:hypothetical protein